eukprot:20-Pelagococcus_subviridis.AAC.1
MGGRGFGRVGASAINKAGRGGATEEIRRWMRAMDDSAWRGGFDREARSRSRSTATTAAAATREGAFTRAPFL